MRSPFGPDVPPNRITVVTRRNIIDAMLLRHDDIPGRLDFVTFLGRVWNLAAMKSTDRRERDLESDLRRHIAWGDYSESEVLYGKLKIERCPDEQFGRFLSECINPVVRPEQQQVAELLSLFNLNLANDGFELVETSRISGQPIYSTVEIGSLASALAQHYDVALSFAGEERAYVEDVATRLRDAGVSVFYDRFEEARLWGTDMTEVFGEVFLHGARFVVMFLSSAYASRIWPTYERRAAVEAAMARNHAYILPVRFDDTQVPGIRDTVAYVDARQKSPDQVAQLVLRKLERG